MTDCPFCTRIVSSGIIAGNDLAAAFYDSFPVSVGHTLIVPRRHVAGFFALTEEEQAAVWMLVTPVRRILEAEHVIDGFNIGINIGEAGGQTIPHAHLHVIPRYAGDVPDPRGGIRCVIAAKARYWQEP
jgi:diadenosine tetraphosphate (Ap4A) HIT family hydrolase